MDGTELLGMGVSPPTFRFRYFRSLFQPLALPHRGASTPHSLQLLCGFDGPWQHLCIAALHLSRSRLYIVHPHIPICVRPGYLPFFEPLRREQPPHHPTLLLPTTRGMHPRPVYRFAALLFVGAAASLHRLHTGCTHVAHT